MTTVALETPGADEADLKTALGALVGMELLSATEITTDVESVDLTLPSGYNRFRILLDVATGGQTLIGALSYDGGSTYLCDLNNYDSYAHATFNVYYTTTPASAANGYLDAVLNLNGANDGPAEIDLSPGGASAQANMSFSARDRGGSIKAGNWQRSIFATQNGRADVLRLFPYGDGDANNLTPTALLTSGYVYLYGVPTP